MLGNTWTYVSRLKYRNRRVYVLDDSKEGCEENKRLAARFGFVHIERPNKGEMKKAGNMKYAYERTSGEIIFILDGDFAPHSDFLLETVPYMVSDPQVGIVQTPQYFETTDQVNLRSPIAYGSARAQEIFYRIIQVARDRLNAAHCCGTCAIYRRSALEDIGGFVQMGHSEDAHTGYTLTSKGWIVRYLPVILSIGLCPDDPYAFFHQQHRWCLGNVVMILDGKFWKAPISWKIKFSYLTGFFYNIHFPLIILLSAQLFWCLFLYNDYIDFAGFAFYTPYLLFSLFCLLYLPTSRFKWGCLYADFLKMYSNTHAIASILMSKTVDWIPTNAKHVSISSAFKEAAIGIALYVFVCLMLVALALRWDLLHLFNYHYLPVQFWIFYNLAFCVVVLWQMYRTMEKKLAAVHGTSSTLLRWQLSTAGMFSAGTLALFWTILAA